MNFNSQPNCTAEVVPFLFISHHVAGSDGTTGDLAFIAELELYDRDRTVLPDASPPCGLICGALPHPGNDSLWYLFGIAGDDTLIYSVFNRQLRNGAGDLTDVRNVPICTFPGSVKVTALSSDNGAEYRLVIHVNNTAELVELVVTADGGLNVERVVVPLDRTIIWQDLLSTSMDIAVSSQNDKIALSGQFGGTPDNRVYVIDIDPNTGLAGSGIEIPMNGFNVVGSRMAFSPNGRFLYVPVGVCDENGCGSIKMYDLSLPTEELIAASETTFTQPYNSANTGHFELALGPDGIIYGTSGYSTHYLQHIARFLQPDCPGGDCGWDPEGLEMPVEAISSFALPWTFNPRVLTTGIADQGTIGSQLMISPNPTADLVTLGWPMNMEPPLALMILDASGRVVHHLDRLERTGSLTLNVSDLAEGHYTACLRTGNGLLRRPLVIAR